jgi:hypothetical protein
MMMASRPATSTDTRHLATCGDGGWLRSASDQQNLMMQESIEALEALLQEAQEGEQGTMRRMQSQHQAS